MQTEERKKEHVDICLNRQVAGKRGNGFERYQLLHNSLPELSLEDIDLSTEFLGKKISYPLYISPMSGGTDKALQLNKNLANAAKKYNIPIGVGSVRAALEDAKLAESFRIRHLTDGLLFANFGAVSLNYGYDARHCQKAVDLIEADALVLHINPLQEAIQPEGNTDFAGLMGKIKQVTSKLDVPVIVKEVGHGISGDIAERLEQAGVSCIDVAGAGGTSWALVEGHRDRSGLGEIFQDWGIATADCLVEAKKMTGLPVIASGGIRTGIDVVKAMCLGASVCGIAGPLLGPGIASQKKLDEYFDDMIKQIRIAMFCIGAKSISDLDERKIRSC